MCFIYTHIFGIVATYSVPFLSSKAAHTMVGVVLTILKFLVLSLLNKFIIKITLRNDCERATYSASIVNKII